jgi:hypothetical protein
MVESAAAEWIEEIALTEDKGVIKRVYIKGDKDAESP